MEIGDVDMKIGDLVEVKTKYEGTKIAVIVDAHYSAIGREWIVQIANQSRQTICSPCDLEVVS